MKILYDKIDFDSFLKRFFLNDSSDFSSFFVPVPLFSSKIFAKRDRKSGSIRSAFVPIIFVNLCNREFILDLDVCSKYFYKYLQI